MELLAKTLDKKARDALGEDDFAVPGKRKLPMQDGHHVKLAWSMVDRTQGLTSAEKSAARARILRKAKSLGVDTSDWHKMQAMRLEAMSLNISTSDGHPNKLPFSGVLTRIDEPSDEAPHGSNGRKVTLTAAAADKALSSLLGMAVNYQPDFAGHDPKAKIGIITSANINGNAITVEGFIYAADFPDVAERIQADKDALGFSFEAQRIWVADPASNPIEIVACEFTGAAILLKNKAAYQSTSISAEAENGEFTMSPDELKALLATALKDAIDPISTRLTAIEAGAAALDTELKANKAVMSKVEPHASAIEAACSAMEAAGIGVGSDNSHVNRLRKMASSMRADAAMGRVPSSYSDYMYSAAAPVAAAAAPAIDAAALKTAVDAALAPVAAELASAKTMVADLRAAARTGATPPERKTIPPAITALLAKAAITLPEGDAKLSVGAVDAALTAANIDLSKRFQLKAELTRAGIL